MLHLARIERAGSLETARFDHCLFAAGYEERATSVARSSDLGDAQWTVWAFSEHRSAGHRRVNDKYFTSKGAATTTIPGDDTDAADSAASTFLNAAVKSGGRILVDVSSMTRCWYGAVIRALQQVESTHDVEITFAYQPGAYRPPPSQRVINAIVGPVRGFSGFALPDAPSTLLLGLGYEPGRAMGVHAEIDPTRTICFYANPGTDPRFVEDVFRANQDLKKAAPLFPWTGYPLQDPFYTFHLVDSSCNALRRDGNVVLTNNGPKIFGLICFLVATRYPETSVWRISSGYKGTPIDRAPAGPPAGLTTTWTSGTMPEGKPAHDEITQPALV